MDNLFSSFCYTAGKKPGVNRKGETSEGSQWPRHQTGGQATTSGRTVDVSSRRPASATDNAGAVHSSQIASPDKKNVEFLHTERTKIKQESALTGTENTLLRSPQSAGAHRGKSCSTGILAGEVGASSARSGRHVSRLCGQPPTSRSRGPGRGAPVGGGAKRRKLHEVLEQLEVPPHLGEILASIRSMRVSQDAPVDVHGTRQLVDRTADEETQQFHALVAAVISSQTKDAVTGAAMGRLRGLPGGLTVRQLASPETTVEMLERTLHPGEGEAPEGDC